MFKVKNGGLIATSSADISSPLKWHCSGGKSYLAKRIAAMQPPHIHYVEPYAGGLSVLLAKDPEGVSEVVNDLNGDLINFWQVLQSEILFPQFSRRLDATPFGEHFWKTSEWQLIDPDAIFDADQVGRSINRAIAFFIRCRQSLAGRMDSFAPLSRNRVRRGMNEQASAWITTVDGLPMVHARLRRVVVLNHDALQVISQQDGNKTCYYLDPPYLHETRATTGEYKHEMTAEQHENLLKLLASIEGKFLLSGYDSELYRKYESQNGWHRTAFDLPNNSASGATKRRMQEIIWTNYAPKQRETNDTQKLSQSLGLVRGVQEG